MKQGVKNAVLVGKIRTDNNGYPCIRLSMEDKVLFDKNEEYAILVLGAVDHKRSVRESFRIVQKVDY